MRTCFLSIAILLFCQFVGISQPITSAEIDQLVDRTMKAFNVPGIAVAVIKDGRIIHSKGYGVSSLNTQEKVDEHTLFGIASNSKAFTTATLGLLVDAKKLKWDDKVIRYIPEFKMYNDYVTNDFTIRDLLTHRSGMGLGAGDLMIWPDSSDFTINDVIYNLRFLKQTSPFRSKYDYDNLLYMVAGEVVARVSGMPWGQFVEENIFSPLDMNRSAASYTRLKDKTNVVSGHSVVDGKIDVIIRHDLKPGESSAGGVYSSISDMSKWVLFHLYHGKYGDRQEKQLMRPETHKELWTAQTIVPFTKNKYNSHFNAYGLGWFLSDVKGTLQVTHTGSVKGMLTQVLMLPEMNLGIVVLTNQEVGAAFRSISSTIKDSYLEMEREDWVAYYQQQIADDEKEADVKIEKTMNSASAVKNINSYAGRYNDNWLGQVLISNVNGKLYFQSVRSPMLRGALSYFKDNTFVVKWADRTMNADAFIDFTPNAKGKIDGFGMHAISPLTDFSYDFQDLSFKRVKN